MARIALDLFCGGGGAARGILAAGFDEIVGIDIKDHRKSYPGHFIRGDALNPPVRLEDFDFVWASPPCQRYSTATPEHERANLPDLVDATRKMLAECNMSCIENVPGSPLVADVVLSGQHVNLPAIIRKRHFELGFFMLQPQPTGQKPAMALSITRNATPPKPARERRKAAGLPPTLSKQEMADGLGLPSSMTIEELGEAIPPAYAEIIAREALRQMH